MAQQGRKKRPSGSTPGGKATGGGTTPRGGRVPSDAQRTAVGHGPKGSALRRDAAAPSGRAGNNRSQLIIWGAAIVVMIAVIAIGIVWNISSNKVENDGYGTAARSTATIGATGVITVTGTATPTPPTSVDVYEDPLCPYCSRFERQYGQQIAQAVDEGRIAVEYHLLNFLDKGSGSGDYSTRAAAALMCAAADIGATPGAWAALHARLFDPEVQPAENAATDLTDAQLAQYVTDAGIGAGLAADAAPLTAAVGCVTSGEMRPMVVTAYDANAATLNQLVGGVRSPVIVHDGAEVSVDNRDWLASVTG